MKKIIVSPSLLSADFSSLSDEVKLAKSSGCEWLHFDVMDGHFVPNISFGAPVLKSIHNLTDMVNDVHLMISDPKKYYLDFVKAGADYITFHYEAIKKEEILPLIKEIKSSGVKVGISIKPNTDVDVLDEYLPYLDLILIMSVEPGFGGQSFMENSLAKISYLREKIDVNQYRCLIEVDGGINDETVKKVKEAGVDAVVAGSYLFGKEDFVERVKKLR